jgi:hypothetical protein
MFSLLLFVYSPLRAPRQCRPCRSSQATPRAGLPPAEPSSPPKRRKAKGEPLRVIEGGRAGVP